MSPNIGLCPIVGEQCVLGNASPWLPQLGGRSLIQVGPSLSRVEALPGMGCFRQGQCRYLRIARKQAVSSIFLMRDESAPLGMDALVHQWPQTLLCRFPSRGSDSAHVGVGAPGGLTVDSCGSPLTQAAALVHGDHLPFRRGPMEASVAQGPVVPGAPEIWILWTWPLRESI